MLAALLVLASAPEIIIGRSGDAETPCAIGSEAKWREPKGHISLVAALGPAPGPEVFEGSSRVAELEAAHVAPPEKRKRRTSGMVDDNGAPAAPRLVESSAPRRRASAGRSCTRGWSSGRWWRGCPRGRLSCRMGTRTTPWGALHGCRPA